jgi:hypothetical protein
MVFKVLKNVISKKSEFLLIFQQMTLYFYIHFYGIYTNVAEVNRHTH